MGGAAQARRRTRAVGAGVSLALHAVVLGWLGLHVAQPQRPPPQEEPPPLTIELVPPLTPPAGAPASPRLRVPVQAPAEAAVLPRPRRAAPVPRQPAHRPLPLPPAPSHGAATGTASAGAPGAAGPAGARVAPGPLPGTEMHGDLRGFLRGSVGCSHEEYLRLSPAERARCDSGFATAYRTTPAMPLPDDRLAAFARQADANARKRGRQEGSLYQPSTNCEIGSAAADKGLGCLPPDAVHGVGKF